MDLSEEAEALLGVDHLDAGSAIGDLREALRHVRELRAESDGRRRALLDVGEKRRQAQIEAMNLRAALTDIENAMRTFTVGAGSIEMKAKIRGIIEGVRG